MKMSFFYCFVLICLFHQIAAKDHGSSKDGMPVWASKRIFGGKTAPEGAAPYKCSIQADEEHVCGCAIISSKWVITAAHCFKKTRTPETFSILTGTNDLHNGGTLYNVSEIRVHPGYTGFNPRKLASYGIYDIALMHIKGEIEFNNQVQVIDFTNDTVPAGAMLQLVGWGNTDDTKVTPEHLQIITLKAISMDLCREMMDNMLQPTHFCTLSPKGEGACLGDSGGPLVWKNKLVGVVSAGIPCALGEPDLFTSVSITYNWIKENIESNSSKSNSSESF